MYFSDIYADRRVTKEIIDDPILQGECLGGALYYRDFQRMASKIGFADPRIVSKRVLNIDDEQIRSLVGKVNFCSVTYRLWKIRGLEDACEDYGQAAKYMGTIKESPHHFILDNHHIFESGKPMLVCSNTAGILDSTRFSRHFDVKGDLSTHYGLFDGCGETPLDGGADKPIGGCC